MQYVQLARIRIKTGEDEIEIDSRDFYLDNHTVDQIIHDLVKTMQEAKISMLDAYETESARPDTGALDGLEDAETFEPEFTEPGPVRLPQIREKLQVLETKSFFDTPRTVSETVEQLREHGWAASPLDVSKVLAKMAFSREILKNSREHRSFYFAKEALLSN